MEIREKLSELINSEINNRNEITGESNVIFIDILCMVQTLDKDYKLRELAKVIQKQFPEYGKLI